MERTYILLALLLLLLGDIIISKNQVKVYVKNEDDNSLFVEFYINGIYRNAEYITPNRTKYYSTYYLENDTYKFKISWKDPNACVQEKEKWENVVINGSTTKILVVDRNEGPCAPRQKIPQLLLYIKNLDDDDLWIDVYVESGYRPLFMRSGASASAEFGDLYTGQHTIKLIWLDPDKLYMQEKTETVYVEENKTTTKTIEVPRNKPGVGEW